MARRYGVKNIAVKYLDIKYNAAYISEAGPTGGRRTREERRD
jgi:hypothetical protein